MDTSNKSSIITAFNDAWNTHNPHKVIDFFADNGSIKILPPPPGNQLNTWVGKEQMLAFVQSQLPNFHVEISNFIEEGDKVSWNFLASSDVFMQIGVSPASGTSEAIFEGDKINSFTLTFSPETVAKMQQTPPNLTQ